MNSYAGTVLVVQHVACETLGTIEAALSSQRLEHRYIRIQEGEEVPPDIGDAAGLIVMGGPMSVYDYERLPHLTREMRLIESALASDRPVLGVCLGSQLLAHVLGAKVYPGAQKEIGWHRVKLSRVAQDDPLWVAAPAEFQAFHWHGDIFDLPRNAENLASSDMTKCQAFRAGSSAYGILFHMEVTAELIHGMAASFVEELSATGQTQSQLTLDSEHHLPQLRTVGHSVFAGWASLCESMR